MTTRESILDIIATAKTTLLEQQSLILISLGVLLAAVLLDRSVRSLSFWVRWPLRIVFLGGALALGYYRATRSLWVCDDAFITFHYSDMLARGHGLVINPGEWVEGYTNFLWAVLLAVLKIAGFDIPRTGLVLNLACFGLAVVVAARAVREAELEAGRIATLPFAAIVLAGSAPFTTFASSGLETMPAAFCVAMGVYFVIRKSPIAAGAWMTAGAMSRPDHILYGVAFGIAAVLDWLLAKPTRERLVPVLKFAAPFVLVFLPYWLIRWKVYGDFYPNTYYAKSGNLAYWSQGAIYSAHFIFTSGLWLVLPVALVLFLGPSSSPLERQVRIGAALSTVLTSLYVTRVGGDFMEFRFYVALLPVLAIAFELAARSWAARRHWAPAALLVVPAVLAAAVAMTPVRLIKFMEKKWHLAAEETFYRVKEFGPELVIDSALFKYARTLQTTFANVEPKPRFAHGCVGFISFYSGLPLIDTFGLANHRVAHKTITDRGRPGHEKFASLEEVLLENGQLSNDHHYEGWDALTKVTLGGEKMYFLKYRKVWADAIRAAGGHAPDPVPELARLMENADRTRLLQLLAFFENYLSEEPARDEMLKPLRRVLGTFGEWDEGPAAEGFVRNNDVPRPAGTAGTAHFESRNQTRFRASVASAPGQVLRFALGGPKSDKLSVSIDAHRFTPKGSDGLTLFEQALEPGNHTLEIADEDPGADLKIDSIRLVDGGPDTLAALDAMEDAQALNRLRALESEWAASPHWARATARQTAHWSFDDPEWPAGLWRTGDAWGAGPVEGHAAGQLPVENRQGARFANGFLPSDLSRGRVELRLPTGRQLAISFLLGGGDDCARLHARLVFRSPNGTEFEIAKACATKDEVLRPHTFTVEVPADRHAFLQFVDDSSDGWGHLLFDDVRVAVRP